MRKKIDQKKVIAFTKRFKQLLTARGHDGKSLEELRIVCHVNERTMIHRYLHAECIPSMEAGEQLCDALDASFSWVMIGRGSMDDFELRAADEIALVVQYRNQTKVGRRKIMKAAFIECADHEIKTITKQDRQTALKIVIKDQV